MLELGGAAKRNVVPIRFTLPSDQNSIFVHDDTLKTSVVISTTIIPLYHALVFNIVVRCHYDTFMDSIFLGRVVHVSLAHFYLYIQYNM